MIMIMIISTAMITMIILITMIIFPKVSGILRCASPKVINLINMLILIIPIIAAAWRSMITFVGKSPRPSLGAAPLRLDVQGGLGPSEGDLGDAGVPGILINLFRPDGAILQLVA